MENGSTSYETVKQTVKYYTDKRFSTIAGTLVYFLLMSITPFMLWLTLVLGNIDVSRFLNHRLLEGASPILRYLKNSAESAADGAGVSGTGGISIIFLATSLYSSTNFFYHLRRSGEIIYEASDTKSGLRLRLMSVGLICAAIISIALVAAVSVIGTAFTEKFLPVWLSNSISLIFITALMFGTAVILNIFACPQKLKLANAAVGSLLTTALWLIIGAGFGVYLKFASPEKLYGKIASLIVFLLWCYVMMCCFVVGMINNGKFATARNYKKNLPLYTEVLNE